MNKESEKEAAYKDLAEKLHLSPETLKEIHQNFKHHYKHYPKIIIKGKPRELFAPDEKLKNLQQRVVKFCLSSIPLPESIHGYRKNHSPYTNASVHVGKKWIAKFDIKAFFPSIHPVRIKRIFKQLGFPDLESKILTELTTARYQVPHGFPSSPKLALIALMTVTRRLEGLAKKQCLFLSCYSDDITISSNYKIEKLEPLITKIFDKSGFKINLRKKKHISSKQQQIVTGYVVNKKIDIPRTGYETLKSIIYNCVIHGPKSQMDLFWEKYPPTSKIEKDFPAFKRRLQSKASQLKRVNLIRYKKLMVLFKKIDWVTGS